jgi:hypothetical protein
MNPFAVAKCESTDLVELAREIEKVSIWRFRSSTAGLHRFYKNVGITSKFQVSEMCNTASPHRRPTNIRCHATKFSHLAFFHPGSRMLHTVNWETVLKFQRSIVSPSSGSTSPKRVFHCYGWEVCVFPLTKIYIFWHLQAVIKKLSK